MKTIIKTGLAAIFLLAISCSKENITSRLPAVAQSVGKALTFTIGQHYGGGIIFYIDNTGQHGLIADTVDLAKGIKWYNGTYITTGATGTAIYTGADNTNKIIFAQGDSGRYAARKCANYKGSGYTDWYLPSKNELNRLHSKRNIVGGFSNTGYWTSTESDVFGYAWYQDFTFGTQDKLSENNNTINIRPIRAF